MASGLYILGLGPEASTRREVRVQMRMQRKKELPRVGVRSRRTGGASLLLECPGAEGQSSQAGGWEDLEPSDTYSRVRSL